VIGKVDLVMWAKNGESSLPRVLKRIDEVIPYENVNQKILVDDHSTDKTVFIAKDFGWSVYPNPRGGISSGANEVLRHVKSDFFVSIEQDVVLAKDWWEKIPVYMDNPQVAVAQGIRISTEPSLKKLEEYVYDRRKSMVSNPERFGVSMDNNIFRAEIIRRLGGFPNDCPVCTDTILMKKLLRETCYKWIIDPSVVSDHIRRSVKENVIRSHWKLCTKTPFCSTGEEGASFLRMLRLFLTSPIRASIITRKKRCLKMLYVYPMIRYFWLKEYLVELLERGERA
jgi:glycosyltransferase involved in cell wall biosynthesis